MPKKAKTEPKDKKKITAKAPAAAKKTKPAKLKALKTPKISAAKKPAAKKLPGKKSPDIESLAAGAEIPAPAAAHPAPLPRVGDAGRMEPQSGVSSSPRPSGASGSQGSVPGAAQGAPLAQTSATAPSAAPSPVAAKPSAPVPAPAPAAAKAPEKPGTQKSSPPPAAQPSAAPAAAAKAAPEPKKLKVQSLLTVRELSEKIGVQVNELISKLMKMGVYCTINQRLDDDSAMIIAQEYGYVLEIAPLYAAAELSSAVETVEDAADLKPRAPIVTIMGHVDHGKTSLLDAVRKSRIMEKEAGGITQHIGAYKVSLPKGDIVFLDTPGHEAFTAMRARGSQVTDIIVLVVAANDGVMPQTEEAIDHARAAGVPIIVAVNKIDVAGANPQNTRQQMAQYDLNPEDWGGKTIFVDISAKKRLNIDRLLEAILLEAEMQELKADPDRPGSGVILEAKLDSRRGLVATLLVRNGTVKIGDPFVVGPCYGKVRALISDRRQQLREAGPSTPVEILGINGTALQAGDVFSVTANERQAREIAEKRGLIQREAAFAHQKHVTFLNLRSQISDRKLKELPIILKADAHGSIQAIQDNLGKLGTSEIQIRFLHCGVGNITESDVLLAQASNAIILGFHVDTEPRAKAVAEKSGLEVRLYSVIYELEADMRAAMEGLLEPEIVETTVAALEVRAVFQVAKIGKIAGCVVLDGKVRRGSLVKIMRNAQLVMESKIVGLKRFKEDAKEVERGMECGVQLENFQNCQPNDRIEVISKEKRLRRLEHSK
ncbi:MAG: translation initiation factor IF-2 [Elusimicrobia bacterium RIFCSPLOWO2_12_FULL_59_9]|nr:MAG: translation initiation factor IF-2 [Elusimicrobia bacterium RIFCSPLOWO2_12_FULL_59_9]